MKRKLLSAIVPIVSLGLIGYGAWEVYHPLGYIVVGLLLWIDITIEASRRRRDATT